MKIRKHKKKTYMFYPRDNSPLDINDGKFLRKIYKFKRKESLMRFLNANFEDALGGRVVIDLKTFNSSSTYRSWDVWFNEYEWRYKKTNNLRIVLKQDLFRGRKIWDKGNISKSSKKHFAFSDKIFNLMYSIGEEAENVTPAKAKNLVKLFYKSGYEDFVPDEETQEYIDSYMKEIPPFEYWSDRCHGYRKKVIIEWFKKENLI